ncbi:MAG: NAD(P)-dependent oxidoreductase [Planctomycetota bacterium]
MTPNNTPLGFIGTGVMGASMAGHLLDAGAQLHITTRTKSKAQDLIDRGAIWHNSPATLATAVDAVFTIVGMPCDVESVYLGDDGLIPNAKPGTILVDMTTSSPALAKTLSEQAEQHGCHALDAPVSGGDRGAREATLSIMVGGPRDAFDAVLPLFEVMGKNIVYQGPAGAGQHCKMCNQIAVAAGMLGVCESLAYAQHAGLDPATVLQSIAAGAAGSWALSNLAPRILEGDLDPGFYIKHFIKDMTIATESAESLGLDAPTLQLALDQYKTLADQGHGDSGTQALIKLYE